MSTTPKDVLERARQAPKFYGRRMGRPMSTLRKSFLSQMLERFQIILPEKPLENLHELIPDAQAFELEIGFGGGEHLVAHAVKNPHNGYIGVEAFMNGVSSIMKLIDAQKISNIRVFPHDVRQLFPYLPSESFQRIYVLFPDPWPKTKHHKRRLINETFLKEVYRLLKAGGELRIASDHADYIDWVQELLLRTPEFTWLNQESCDQRPDDWCQTRYEEKALEKGIPCIYMRFAK